MQDAQARQAFEEAVAQIEQNDRDGARETLTHVLESHPDYAEARLALGILLGTAGEKGEARRQMRLAMEQLGNESRPGTESLQGQVLVNLCALALEEDDWEEVAAWESAFEDVQEALDRQGLREQAASILFDAGNRAVKETRVTQGRRLYLRAVALDSDFGEAWYNLAVLASEDGELREAQEHLRRAIDAEGTFADAHFLLGTLLLPNSPEEALQHMESAVRLSPENAQWTTLVGSAHARVRNFERAREFFARALQLDDSQADAHLGFAVVSRALGDSDMARDALRRAFELNPELAQRIQDLMSE